MADGSNNVVENWEDLNEEQIFDQSKAVSELRNLSSSKMNKGGPIVMHGDDSVRTQYLPPEPSVKILKRPSKEERLNQIAATECHNGNSRPLKTLQQREAEYAEARLRIMGNSSAPDEDLNNCSSSQDSPSQQPYQQKQSSLLSSSSPLQPTATYTLLRPSLNDSLQLTRDPTSNIVRNPRGPHDGAPGFSIRR